MEAKLGKAGKQAFRIANLLDDAADALRKRSKRAYRESRIVSFPDRQTPQK